jgi:serine/threonine-protein kinase RsbT
MEAPPAARDLCWRVTREQDAIWSGAEARRLARTAGFSDRACTEIGIALGELVSNAVKYAGEGTVRLSVSQESPPALTLVVEDHGPGIEDVDLALRDGFSGGQPVQEHPPHLPRRGLGQGLGAARRLLDELQIEPHPEGGTRITGRKYRP